MKRLILVCINLLFVVTIYAQKNVLTINGVVYDETNQPLPSASVYLKDRPGVGTLANIDGQFEIKASKGDILVISFMGYKNYEYPITKNEPKLEVKMSPDSEALDEVIIVGTGVSQRKITSVGAVTNVDMAQLRTPATSLNSMLGGVVPGIISLQSSGEPGKNIADFWIRGIGTFGANSGALVLVDGLEGDLSSLDPADIESFSVLKDASATAVYGVRGANGVILVTTKRGKVEKLEITARASATISNLTRMPDYLGAYDYAKLANEAREVRGDLPLYSDTELGIIRGGLDPDIYPNVNWRDEILKNTSFQQTYYLSARGGGSIARYFLSLGASNEEAIYKQDKNSKYNNGVGYNTYNYRANIDINITPSTTLYFGSSGFLSSKNEPGNANTDFLWSSQAKLTPLTIPTQYSNGYLPAYGKDDEYSPYVMLNHTGMSNAQTFKGNYTLSLNQDLSMILKGLKLRLQGAYSNEVYFKETRFLQPAMYYASGRTTEGNLIMVKKLDKQGASYSKEEDQFRKYHFEANLNYETRIADIHRFTALLYYYMSDQKKAGDSKDNMSAIPVRYQGLSSRITYSLKDTYMIDLNFGYTGSENFEPGKQFGFFPSIAGGWIPTGYDFVREKLPWLDFLKFRASYGLVGNDRITDKRFPYLTLIDEGWGTAWGATGGGLNEKQMGANNLQWEKAKKFDFGIEGKLFNNRIDFVVDIFKDWRDGIFQQRAQIPDYVGLVNLPFGNVGKMKSWGTDGNLSFTHQFTKDFSMILRGNFTLSKNKVENWEQLDPKYPYQNKTGLPHNYQEGYIALGLFKDEEDVKNSPSQSFGNYKPGDIKYKDVNADGVINDQDKVPLSYANYPRLMYGFGLELRYKKLALGVLFKGTGNTDFYYVGKGKEMGYLPFYGEQLGNVLDIAANPANRWIPKEYAAAHGIDLSLAENPNARFPRLSYGSNANNSQLSTFWKGNSRYLRLQEINLNYNLSTPRLKRIVGVSSIDFQLVANNVYVWDKVKYWDPEQAESNGQAYPIPTRYSLQLYINF